MYPRIPHALLLAEFDIDKGSTLRTSVPIEFMSALPLDANVIAELCLPEGGHNRSDDSTVFIFNREVRAHLYYGEFFRDVVKRRRIPTTRAASARV